MLTKYTIDYKYKSNFGLIYGTSIIYEVDENYAIKDFKKSHSYSEITCISS